MKSFETYAVIYNVQCRNILGQHLTFYCGFKNIFAGKRSAWNIYLILFVVLQKFSSLLVLRLAFQSLGVVYGDLGTSPLYVFYNTFPNQISVQEDILGALSLIIYSLTLIPLIKYVFVVLRANDNGQGKCKWILIIFLGILSLLINWWSRFKWHGMSGAWSFSILLLGSDLFKHAVWWMD